MRGDGDDDDDEATGLCNGSHVSGIAATVVHSDQRSEMLRMACTICRKRGETY